VTVSESFAARIDLAGLGAEGVYHAESLSTEGLVDVYVELRGFVSQAATEQRGLVVALV
jgi:hypothetical protein